MKKKQKTQVYDSIDKLSQEMAKFMIDNNKTKLIAEIEEDIIKNEKMKKGKDQDSDRIILFSSESSGKQLNLSQKDNNSINSLNSKYTNKSNKSKDNDTKFYNNSSKINPISIKDSSNKKSKKVSFALDEKKKNNEEMNKLNISKENININENNNKKEDKNIIKNNNIEINEGNKIIIKNDKEDLEITLSPIYGYKDEDQINYYNIKSYIDKNKKTMKKRLSFEKDKSYNTNVTATFGNSRDNTLKLNKKNTVINKAKISGLLLKEKEKENKNNSSLILKSYTQKTINSLTKKPIQSNKNNFDEKRKKTNTIKEKEIFIENIDNIGNKVKNNKVNLNNSDNSDEYIRYIDNIDNISEEVEEENKRSKQTSNSKNSSLSSNTGNSSYDFHITTTSYNSNNIILNYTKSGRKSKYTKFLEKQLKRQKLTELKINRMKRNQELKEYQNYYSSPKINSLSLEIVKNKGNYVPLFKRAIELENEKKMKILINQKIKNNNFIVNNSNFNKRTKKQISDFFYAQMDWKDKIDKKTNKLKKKLKDKSIEKISEYLNYEMKINPKSELIILKKRKKNSLSLIDISQNNSEIINNSANRLYKDYEIRQKKLKRLKKELTPSFRPSINKSPPLYNYKTSRNNYKVNINQKIEEVKIVDNKNNDNSYKFKYQSNSQTSIRNNSVISIKSQKSRNPKNNSKSQISSKYFKKENNLKSTAVDSRNTKSGLKISNDINNTKLEKINENNIINEENSNKNNNSINKNSDKNKNNKSKSNIDSSLNNIQNMTRKTKYEKENPKSQYNTKNNNTRKDHSKSHISKNNNSKESKSQESKTNTSNTDTENNKTNSSHNESKNSVEESTMKNNKIKKVFNKSNDKEISKENHNNKNKTIKKDNNEYIKTIASRASKQNEKKENNNIIKKFKRNNSSSTISSNINIKNQIKKSLNNIKINKNIFMKNAIKPPFNRHKSVITRKSSEFLFSNKYKDKDKLSPNIGNQNKNDSIEINNFENNNINAFNDFLTNNSKSKVNNDSNNIIKSSFEDEILKSKKDSFFDENFKFEKSSAKKDEKKLIKKYKFNNSDDEDNEEEEEEIEESCDKNSKQNKSISWIKKLEEISKNEENKTEREKDELNKKKKLGASTTRSQTKRKNSDKEKDIYVNLNKKNKNKVDDKLYMLNSRNNSSTGKLNPYTFTAKNEIFYKFFLKKK